jgi:hypothetical protein
VSVDHPTEPVGAPQALTPSPAAAKSRLPSTIADNSTHGPLWTRPDRSGILNIPRPLLRNFRKERHPGSDQPRRSTHVIELFLKVVFYVCVGLALAGAILWYVTSAYEALTGRAALVILPFTVADNGDDKSHGRSEVLSKMLHAQLQQIEHDLAASQKMLVEGARADAPAPATEHPQPGETKAVTSITPPLFVTQGVSLQTRLLEPTEIKISVAGVDVGGLLPWFQKLLITQRTLEFAYYETSTSVIVYGSLQVLGLSNDALRVEIPKEEGKPANLDKVAWMVATEIERRRLSRDSSNRVEALSTTEFGELIKALNETARLNRQVALGRPAREQFGELLARLEPLASEVHDWYQLQLLVASMAESAGKLDRAVAHLQSAHQTRQTQIESAGPTEKAGIQRQIAGIQAKIDALKPKAQALAADDEQEALERIRSDAKSATAAFNKLFRLSLPELPVHLLPAHEPSVYTDGKEFFAPPEVAQLPELTWHDMTWQYINKYLPVFSGELDTEGEAVAYSYSDVLTVLIRQIGLIDSPDPTSWNAYPGAVAWLRAAVEKRDFRLGDDRRPLRSFADPGKAYTDPVIGNDPQIAHYRDFKPKTEKHAGAGIGNKAFYEAARRLGPARAGDIWLGALVCLRGKKPVTYRALAACLIEVAGADRPKVEEALSVVGLGVSTGRLEISRSTKK